MKTDKRNIHELPTGIRHRLIRLTYEYAVLSSQSIPEQMEKLDTYYMTYKQWQTRSYHLMLAVNKLLVSEGKEKKYVFSN
jgi:hypothetical protein